MLCIKQNQYGNMIKIALRVISIGILFSAPEELNASEKLYVFYPSATRPHIIFEKLQSSMKDVRCLYSATPQISWPCINGAT